MTRMTTEEALKIFTIDEIDKLNSNNLKTIKKEFLLEFQLTDQPVVVFNGHTLDKNAVIEIFDDLSLSLEKHLEKHKIAVLDTFLESGDLTYLLNEGIGKRIIKGIVSLPQKRDKLIYKLAEIIADILLNPSDDREKALVQVQKITGELPLDYEEKAFATSFRYLRNEVESIKSRYDNPFYDNFSLKLEPELQTMVDVRFLKLFQLLPEKFQFLAYEYSLWCYEFVIKLTQFREKNYAKYPIDSLLIIRNAALIASEYYEENENLRLSSFITTLLANPAKLVKNDKVKFNKNKKREKWRYYSKEGISPWAIIGFIAIILITIIRISNVSNKSSDNSYNHLPSIEKYEPLDMVVPKYLNQAKIDTSFKYIGSDGRKMTFMSSNDKPLDSENLDDVVFVKASPNPFRNHLALTGEFVKIKNFRIIDLNGDVVYRLREPYIKENVIPIPILKGKTFLIRGNTENGPVLIELIRESK